MGAEKQTEGIVGGHEFEALLRIFAENCEANYSVEAVVTNSEVASEEGVNLVIGGTERRRKRPQGEIQQQAQYSGKKKAHTDKNLILVNRYTAFALHRVHCRRTHLIRRETLSHCDRPVSQYQSGRYYLVMDVTYGLLQNRRVVYRYPVPTVDMLTLAG